MNQIQWPEGPPDIWSKPKQGTVSHELDKLDKRRDSLMAAAEKTRFDFWRRCLEWAARMTEEDRRKVIQEGYQGRRRP